MYKANDPMFGRNWKCDYWLQTTMVLQSTLDDYRDLPRDRRAGTLMIPDKQYLEYLFQQKKRIWYLTLRRPHNLVNDLDVSRLVRGTNGRGLRRFSHLGAAARQSEPDGVDSRTRMNKRWRKRTMVFELTGDCGDCRRWAVRRKVTYEGAWRQPLATSGRQQLFE